MIEVRDVTRQFGALAALSHASFTVEPGEIVALLGPNGAGKTTASRIIGGILAPSDGDVLVDGISVRADANAVRARCGFVTDQPSLYERMPLRRYLGFFARLYEVSDPDVRRRCGHGAVRAGQGGRARRARRRERWAARVAIRDRRSADDEYGGPPVFARRGHPCRHARGRGAVARGGVHGDPRGRAHVKWWLIAWREIRWEVFLDRASLLRMSIFIVIPMLFIFSNRRIPLGTGGDLTLVALAAQSVFFPALSGVALIAATFTAEKENGTLVPLLAAPIRDFDIVLGKLVGMVVPVMLTCAVTLAAADSP